MYYLEDNRNVNNNAAPFQSLKSMIPNIQIINQLTLESHVNGSGAIFKLARDCNVLEEYKED